MAGGVGQVAGGSGEKRQDLGPRLQVRHLQVLRRGGVMEVGGSRGGLCKGKQGSNSKPALSRLWALVYL